MDLPDDGVCDFIFFDSLGDPFDRLGQPATIEFKEFQALAAMGKATQYGVSINPLCATSSTIPRWSTTLSLRTT
ncbi:hypothetical protein MTO96_037996 [Rhipicephalus appendiculatus]